MIRVGVFGAAGRMGSQVCRAVMGDPGTELVSAVDPFVAGQDLDKVTGISLAGMSVGAEAADMDAADVEVVVDFTVAASAMDNLRWCAANRVHAVVGTTGFSQDDMEELSGLFGAPDGAIADVAPLGGADVAPLGGTSGSMRPPANCLIAPNFSIGAVLMMRFAEMAAAHMDAGEIIELHHDGKVDAPSGTSLTTARRMGDARRSAGKPAQGDPTTATSLHGVRGGAIDGGVRIHSIRLPGLVAHQEVIFGGQGESLAIRHDSYDRASFMPGVLLAVKRIPTLAGLTLGIEPLLEL